MNNAGEWGWRGGGGRAGRISLLFFTARDAKQAQSPAGLGALMHLRAKFYFYLLFSQLLQLLLHVGVLELRVVVAADVGGVGVAGGGRRGVAVHGHGLAARRVGALFALAAAGAPQEGHGPLHEVAAAVLRQGVGRRGGVGRGHAAALLVGRVRVRVVVVVVSLAVHGLGPGDVVRGEVGAGGGRGLVKVGRGRVAVAARRPRRVCGVAVGRRCRWEAARGSRGPVFALGLMAARATGTTRGRRGAAAGFALLQTGNDIRRRGDDLKEGKKASSTNVTVQ